jgi:MFS superfamily sulfate permease-like transporter
MSLIPLASLSAILIIVGYKLAKPVIFKEMYSSGKEQFIPFIITIIGIITINLLNGIILGLIAGLLFSLYRSYQNSYELKDVITNKNGVESHYISLAEEISFFNKASLMQKLESIPNGSQVTVDFARNKYMALDIEVTLKDFETNAEYKNLKVKFINNN